VTTEDAASALRKATKWAQSGLVVSTGPPVDLNTTDSSANEKKKLAGDVLCKEKNVELARFVCSDFCTKKIIQICSFLFYIIIISINNVYTFKFYGFVIYFVSLIQAYFLIK
jgi:hypothetical protein